MSTNPVCFQPTSTSLCRTARHPIIWNYKDVTYSHTEILAAIDVDATAADDDARLSAKLLFDGNVESRKRMRFPLEACGFQGSEVRGLIAVSATQYVFLRIRLTTILYSALHNDLNHPRRLSLRFEPSPCH